MKSYYNFSLFYFVSLIILAILYYYTFQNPIKREPFFYLYNKKIILTESQYTDILLLKKINDIQYIPTNKVLIDTYESKYILPRIQYNFWKFIQVFYVPILTSFISLFFSIWFYESLRDTFFSLFFFLKTSVIFISLYAIYYQYELTFIVWCIIITLFIISFINLNIRFLGKSLNSFVLLTEAFIFTSLLLLSSIGEIPRKQEFLFEFYLQIFFTIFSSFLILNIIRIFNQKLDRIDKLKIISFITGNIIGFFPFIVLFQIPKTYPFIYLLCFSLYPLLISYSVYRMYLVPSQTIITRAFVTSIISLLFASLYFLSMYIYAIYLPDYIKKYKVFYDIFFLIVLSLIIDPLRYKFFNFIKNKLLIPEKKYILSLMRLSNILARISRPNLAIEQFLKEIEQTLEVEKCLLLFPPNLIPNIQLQNNMVLEVESKQPIWKYIKPEKIIAIPYIVYSTGIKKQLFSLLYENKILLLIGLGEKEDIYKRIYLWILKVSNYLYQKWKQESLLLYKTNIEETLPKTALLIGYPRKRDKFYLKEIRYLQEVARLATMMLTNMYILFREVDKRKKIRYIIQTGKFQKQFAFRTDNFPSGIHIEYFNQPVLSVSGDYIDIVSLDSDRIAVFLGDVSGHGLGTGYLVSAIRSIVHYCLDHQFSLIETLNILNIFLTDRYKGYEFLTLFAFILEISSGKMEFINAAHPGIFIKPKDEPLQKIEKTQKLLGISNNSYRSFFIEIKPKTKLFLFSDGVIETVNKNHELFGEKRLIEFLNHHSELPLSEITQNLWNELKNFRESPEFQDDTTFLAIEYIPQKTLLDIILRNFLR